MPLAPKVAVGLLVVGAVVAGLSHTWSADEPDHGVGDCTGPIACIKPQLEGTIVGIQPGTRTVVRLSGVQEVFVTQGPFHHYASLTVTIGPGRWVAPGHWQAAHDAMDLFIGELIMAVPGHIATTIAGQTMGFSGVVYRIRGNLVTLQRVNYFGDNSQGQGLYQLAPTLTTFHIAPYTLFSWEGLNAPAFDLAQLRVGQYIDGLWEGSTAYPVAAQWTVFPSLAAWAGTAPLPSDYAILYPAPP